MTTTTIELPQVAGPAVESATAARTPGQWWALAAGNLAVAMVMIVAALAVVSGAVLVWAVVR